MIYLPRFDFSLHVLLSKQLKGVGEDIRVGLISDLPNIQGKAYHC